MYNIIENYLLNNNTLENLLKCEAKFDLYILSILNGYRGIIAASTYTRYNKLLLANKLGNNTKPLNYILRELRLKYCYKCDTLKIFEDFTTRKDKVDGLQTCCKICDYKSTLKIQKHTQAKRRAAKLQRTPIWSETEYIRQFYLNCPEGNHIDHIIPLQGKLVSGLHVLLNLQYLTPKENMSKGNRYEV